MANSEKIADLEKSINEWKQKVANGGPAFIEEIIARLEEQLAEERNS